VLTATCSSDLIAILRGGPYSVVTQLRDNPSCKSSFLKVPLTQGVTFWVRTHASQPLVTRPGSVSTFLSYHAHGSPLGVALSWVVSVPGVSQRWRGYFHKSGYSSLVLGIWPWSHLSLLFITVLRYWGPSWCRPLHGLSYPWVSGGDTVDALSWWRLILATPYPGDASSWRRLNLATPTPGDALSGQPEDACR